MRERLARAPWRLLAGAAAVLAGAVLALTALLGGGEDTAVDVRGGGPVTPTTRTAFVPQLGLAVVYPPSWTQTVDAKVIRLRSPEGSILLTAASPFAGRRPADVKRTLLASLRKRLAPARTLRSGPARLGPRKVYSVELAGRSSGRPVRALALVDDTPYRTYAVTLITSASPSARRLREARAILQAIRFVKPSKPPGR